MTQIIRVPYSGINNYMSGEEYTKSLVAEANQQFSIMLSLLSSYWKSSVDGPVYARMMKAMSLEFARMKLAIDSLADSSYKSTRTEFLYQTLTSVMFPEDIGIPSTGMSSEGFRDFMVKLLNLYYNGSIPTTISGAVSLLTDGIVQVDEVYRSEGIGGIDISSQFEIGINVTLKVPDNSIFNMDHSMRTVLAVIKPAHSIYKLRFIMNDSYDGVAGYPQFLVETNKIKDVLKVSLSNCYYDDFRKFTAGFKDIDRLGVRTPKWVEKEDHSSEF